MNDASRPLIVGVLNTTPDSFSDGGRYLAADAALQHALRMVEEGADLIDVGGESTRPGAQPVEADAQLARVEPVITRLRQHLGDDFPVSIDTASAAVASRAIEAGANVINDVSGGADPHMLPLAAQHGVPICLMHMRGVPATMQESPRYDDVVGEVVNYLLARAAAAEAAGVARKRIIIDPGLGFGKTFEHNLALIRHLDRFVATGYSVMLGASRKRFLKEITNEAAFGELAGATCATTVLGVLHGVRLFRVHDVKANRQAADVAWRIRTGRDGSRAP
jgi:dihydropteroate synthase